MDRCTAAEVCDATMLSSITGAGYTNKNLNQRLHETKNGTKVIPQNIGAGSVTAALIPTGVLEAAPAKDASRQARDSAAPGIGPSL